MAIHRIYPQQDTTIWSEPNKAGTYGNAGIDEVLEIGGYPDPSDDDTGRTKRILLQFDTDQIKSVIDNKTANQISCSIYLPLAEASQIPVNFKVEVHPVAEAWVNGIGKLHDIPTNTTGVTWKDRDGNGTPWTTIGGSYDTATSSSKEYKLNVETLDLEVDVTEMVKGMYSGSIDNNGFLIKLEDQYENYTSASILLQYFGSDTNTIFRPYLEFKELNDFYNPGPETLTTSTARVGILNQKSEYINEGNVRFRISAKPLFPVRAFSTGSIYKTDYALPSNSQYSVVDKFSNETIIKFSKYTNINADSTGNYFDLDMSILAPERYYKLKIKSTLDNSTVVFEEDNLFKVVRNG